MSLSTFPPTRRDVVVDVHHGIDVADPYRWLEDGDDAEVTTWVAAQNDLTRGTLDVPERAAWHKQLVKLMELPVFMETKLRGGTLFCQERLAGAEQSVLTRRSATDRDAEPVVLLDPAQGTADAAAAIDWFYPSPDGSVIAVGTSEGGTELSALRLITGEDGSPVGTESDVIPETRAASVAWEPDGSGFFYTRYPEGDEYNRTVHYHRIGGDWDADPVVWDDRPDPQSWPSVVLSNDGRWLLVLVQCGYKRVDVHVHDRQTETWTTLIEGVEAYTWLDFAADDASLVGTTNLDAPRGRVVRIRLDASMAVGPATWETLVAERADVISDVGISADGLLLITSHDAVDTIHRLDPDGRPRTPETVGATGDFVCVADHGLVTSADSSAAFVVLDSFEAPPSLWRLTPDGGASPWSASDGAVELTGDLAVRRVTYPSRDGTEIGLFIVHRADVHLGPDTPTMLWGYGGFRISVGPGWRPEFGAWCAAGGVLAVASLRGGNEKGEEWHRAGSRENKQNVFDDFQAAGDFLVSEGLVSRERLAICGRSNGGLLVGVTITQRPDLCAAAWCGVPLLDMVRYPQFLIAKLWTPELGDPEVAEEFGWLYAYSPYHHVVDGACYPATLISTAEGDTRVDPSHARKMAALLQAASSCQQARPILLFQEGRAGHGVGKPVSKRADELADGLTFLGTHVALTP